MHKTDTYTSKIVIFGYDELLLSSLKIAEKHKAKIEAVVFPSNRIKDSRAKQIKDIVSSQGHQILIQPPRKKIASFVEELNRIAPDFILVWSYSMILPEAIIEVPKYGCLNVHMGLLPEYRGANGIQRALINGESKTGVTLHYMDSGVDTGTMVTRGDYPISNEDDIVSLMIKSKYAGELLLDRSWESIINGKASRIEQDESKANYYPPLPDEERKIDWDRSGKEIYNLNSCVGFSFFRSIYLLERRNTYYQKSYCNKITDQNKNYWKSNRCKQRRYQGFNC